jgi:AcrR family transcriptional regulator
MPRLWSETIETHRREVHEAILDTTATLAAEHGVLSVTMSQIADETGIGRATLYKYFSDVESILTAWHQRQVGLHLEQLAEIRDQVQDPCERLEAVLETYALIQFDLRVAHSSDLAAHLHGSEHVAHARRGLQGLVKDLLASAAAAGCVRSDVAPDELAGYCLHALSAAGGLSSKSAVRRLVQVTLAGLRPE